MSLFSCFVAFIIIWWTVLFFTLPFGVRSQLEENDIVKGTEPGAPQKSLIKKKMLITTGITFVLFVIVFCVVEFKLYQGWL